MGGGRGGGGRVEIAIAHPYVSGVQDPFVSRVRVQVGISYPLTILDSLTFGSLISATETCSCSEAGSYLRLIDFCVCRSGFPTP